MDNNYSLGKILVVRGTALTKNLIICNLFLILETSLGDKACPAGALSPTFGDFI